MNGPGFFEDTKNLMLIGGAACIGIAATVAMTFSTSSNHGLYVYDDFVAPVVSYEVITPLSGSNRLYGTVLTRKGEELTGFLRWDRNEASWGDILDGTGQNGRQSGLRFGHLESLEPLNSRSALLTMRSGQTVEMSGGSSDLGRSLRALIVSTPGLSDTKLGWKDIEFVDFYEAPQDLIPNEGRLYGTLTTTSGESFTGTITWDVDEVYSSDVLDGEMGRVDFEVPFGAIERIERHNSRAARVLLHTGEELVLSGTNDVNRQNSGIAVSDPELGQISVDWKNFESVRFHGADNETQLGWYNGGKAIEGTVITESGDELTGLIEWDLDETRTWELLNGDANGIEYKIEFGKIANITKTDGGSLVELLDGRSMELSGSNDVQRGNQGIRITTDGQSEKVRWSEFSELRINR